MSKRLFIVSSRLPVVINDKEGLKPSSGGLVTAINSYLNKTHEDSSFSETFWVGIPGCTAGMWSQLIEEPGAKTFSYLPVFVSEPLYNGFYNGHSNSMLWPLFHYFPSYAEYSIENYNNYRQVNEQFLHLLIKYVHPTDTIWIHDYHLLPLANMLRKEVPELTIGFFLHIPFPSYEIIRLMPRQWQEELVEGMLGSDLVGFHTIDYATHFLKSVQMILGIDHDRHIIRNNDRLVKIDVFPISIDFDHFQRSYDNDKVVALRKSYSKMTTPQKLIFSVDRLDYTKGVNNRLKAYEFFLLQYPEYQGKVIFIMVIVPSRDHIPKYAERKQLIDGTISHINSTFGNLQWQPVVYQYNHLLFEEMIALYTSCDLALLTPLRDGMNLVAKEFVASRKDKKGVLILSEMAGAARELTDALIINPNDIVEIANMIRKGLEMPEPEQSKRLETMQTRIRDYDVLTWATDFMRELESIKRKQQDYRVKLLDDYSKRALLDNYRKARRRLLLLDYDGTLVTFSSDPAKAVPDEALIELLEDLSVKNTDLYLISGRNDTWLEKHFGNLNINLIAEHGARIRVKGDAWTNEISERRDWKEQVEHIMQSYVRRCPQSFIEEKDFSMVWHYRNANIEQGKLRAAELLVELSEYSVNRDLQVVMGNKIVEIRNTGIDKGTAIRKVLGKEEYDFVLAIGDDTTDEDMFKVLASKKDSFTIKVGSEASFAQFNLYTPQMVISLLQAISHISNHEKKAFR